MKSLILCFALSVCCLTEIAGQHLFAVDSNKYRVNLPDYWKSGNRVWKILTDKMPLICEELKDKELCGDDCNPRYTIEFEMSEPVIFDYFPNHISSSYVNNRFVKPSEIWEIQTFYGFECSLLLRNEKGVLITRFILVDTNEVWKIANRVTLASFAPPPSPAIYSRRTSSNRTGVPDLNNIVNMPDIPATGQAGETPYAYINNNREKLVPAYRGLFAVVDMKINSW